MSPVRPDGQHGMQLRVDATGDDKAYAVHADIPGVKKEDIHAGVE